MSLSVTRETVDTKAHRLVQQNRITWAHGVAVIAGDHQTYVVRRAAGTWSCDCPWGTERPDSKPCSHILAAALTAPAVTAPTPALNQAVQQLLASNTVARPTRRPAAPLTRYANPVRVDDPRHLEALRQSANPTVRYITQGTQNFAVCEQAVLDCALTLAGGDCR